MPSTPVNQHLTYFLKFLDLLLDLLRENVHHLLNCPSNFPYEWIPWNFFFLVIIFIIIIIIIIIIISLKNN